MSLAVAFSSANAEWSTPQRTFDLLAREFGPFDLDVCANCDDAFFPARRDAKTCSERCRQALRRSQMGRRIRDALLAEVA